jgi:hypothetical protein
MLHETVDSAEFQARKDSNAALAESRWMLVAFALDDTGKLTCRCTRWEFPNDLHLECTRMLLDQLTGRTTALPTTPLPRIPMDRFGLIHKQGDTDEKENHDEQNPTGDS